MTDFKTAINTATGEEETVEYYTHEEFIERKKAKLKELENRAKELENRAKELGAVDSSNLIGIRLVAHMHSILALANEYYRVRSAKGPMVVDKKGTK